MRRGTSWSSSSPAAFYVLTGIGLVAISIAGGFIAMQFSDLVTGMRVNMPINDLGADYLYALGWAALLTVMLVAVPMRSAERAPLLLLWGAMLLVALVARIFVEDFYGAMDAFASYRHAKMGDIGEFEFGRGTPIVNQMFWLHQQYLIDSYHAIKVSWSFIGLWAIYAHYRAATLYLGKARPKLLLWVGLFPGILFWSTTAGKDPIVLLGIGLYAMGVVGLLRRRYLGYAILIIAGIALASMIRIWLALIMVAPLFMIVMVGRSPKYLKVLVLVAFVVGFFAAFSLFADRFQIVAAEDIVESADSVSQFWAKGGSGQTFGGGMASFGDMVKFMPVGAFTALFRPLPGEVGNVFGVLASLENLILLSALFLAYRRTRWHEMKDPIIAWAIAFIVVWAAIYGFASYQNLGTAVRFKLQVLPMLWLVLLYLSRQRPRESCAKASRNRYLPLSRKYS
jgi:hypothetical protein